MNLCETNDPYHFKEKIDDKFLNLNSIEKSIINKVDIIGRGDVYKKIDIDKRFPEYLLKNLKNYHEWII